MSFATKNKTHACTESLTVTQKIENKSVPYSFARITGIFYDASSLLSTTKPTLKETQTSFPDLFFISYKTQKRKKKKKEIPTV
jgi:glycerol uptake facilitator-like aquaporin